MVAISSSRRQVSQPLAVPRASMDALATLSLDEPGRAEATARASRRAAGAVEVSRDRQGQIVEVRIGRWRTLASAPQRRLAEVRELGCQRVAVKIERLCDASLQPSSEIWQLYDLDGRLDASMQTTPDGRFAMLTNYRTRQACRLALNVHGVLETVESWNI